MSAASGNPHHDAVIVYLDRHHLDYHPFAGQAIKPAIMT
jgi:hypothetical protein